MAETTIGAIVLAAGLSSRMGQFKLLLKWLDEQPLLAHIVEKVSRLPVSPIVVVTGHRADAVRAVLTGYDVTFAHNTDYAAGEILSSMKTGLRAMPETVAAVLVVPGDTPRIPQEVMQQVMDAHAPQAIVAPRYAGERGHPVLFDRHFWQALLDLPPDGMPRDVLRANKDAVRLIDVSSDGILADVDTPEAYERELQRAKAESSQNSET
jgi:molybdenum cofactor cytidylyltransferase